MTLPTLPAYEDARLKAFQLVSGYLLDVTGSADYFNSKLQKGAGQLGLVKAAYSERLSYKASLANSSTGSGLAYLEDSIHLLGQMKKAFGRAADEIRQTGDASKGQELAEAEREFAAYQPFYDRDVVAFFHDYNADIAQERLGKAYKLDRDVVNGVWVDMETAMKTASWEPEFIDVAPQSGGVRRPLEAPSSAKLGEIAKLAPQLKRLGLGV